jgi:glutamine synthetase
MLKQDEVIKAALGEHVLTHFVEAKAQEWDEYRLRVHDWEIDKYLGAY